MLAKEMKSGAVIQYEGAPVIIENLAVQSPSARGASTLYKFRGRNLITKQKIDFTLKGTDNYPEADFEKRAVKLMYRDGDDVHFLDQEDFNQYTLAASDCEEQLKFMTEELEGVVGLIYQDECVGLQLPAAVDLNIQQTDPAVKGNSATARTKPAILETGYQVMVPEYIKENERIRVDTRTGEFLSRA
jgi:elongation factor P